MYERFARLPRRDIRKLTLNDFTVTEIRHLISETVLTERDIEIAEMRFIKLYTVEKIAERLGYDERTIKSACVKILDKLLLTIQRVL